MRKKLGHYIAGLGVVAVLGGGAYEAFEKQDNDDNKDKIEYSQNSLRDSLKEDCKDALKYFNDFFARFSLSKDNKQSKEELKEELKEDSGFSYGVINEVGKAPRIANLQYQNDTVSLGSSVTSDTYDAYYSPDKNTITDNVFEGQEQSWVKVLINLAHEAEHMHQADEINYSADMSFEQHYNIHNYTEVGATIAGLLQARQLYIEASSKEERDFIVKESRDDYWYYFDKVESGEINPLSMSVKDFDEEMKFIVNETLRYWDDYIEHGYKENHEEKVLFYIQRGTGSVEINDENYLASRNKILDIGGISFSDSLSKGDEVLSGSYKMWRADKLIAGGGRVENVLDALKKNGLSNDADVFLANANNKELKNFSNEQRYNLAVNYYFAAQIRGIEDLVDAKVFWESIPGLCHNDTVYQKTSQLVENIYNSEGWPIKASDKEYKEQIRKIWSYIDENGNEACFLDKLGVDEPDFSQYIAGCEKLKLKDAYGFSNYMREHFSSYVNGKNNEESSGRYKVGEEYRTGVNDTKPQSVPRYDLETRGRRSKVLKTSDVIDTRSDFLAKERQKRVEMEKIHGKTEESSQTAKQTDSNPVREIHVNDLIKMHER